MKRFLYILTLITVLVIPILYGEEIKDSDEYIPIIPSVHISSPPSKEVSGSYNPTINKPSVKPIEGQNTVNEFKPVIPSIKPREVESKESKESYVPVIEDQSVIHQALSGCNVYDIPIVGSGMPILIYDKYRFSPSALNRDWYSCDHIGYTDKAFTGVRHIACINPGVLMLGYAEPPYSDFMIREFESGDKVINVVQAPYRADWHTFKGNGILFNATLSGSFEKFENTPEDELPSISGYFLCAEQSKIFLYHFSNVLLNSLVNDSSVLESCDKLLEIDKPCPAQNFTIIYRGGWCKIYLGTKLIFNSSLDDGSYAGLLSCYGPHNCESLSSIYFNNFSYNGIDYLKGGQDK